MEAHKRSCLPQHVHGHLRGEIKGCGGRQGWEGRGGRVAGPLAPPPLPPTLRHPCGPASSPLCLEALPPGWLGSWGVERREWMRGKGGRSEGRKEGLC